MEKNDQTGLIRLANRRQSDNTELGKRFESLEKAIISYFRSRKEDDLKKPIPAINSTVANTKTRISSFDVIRPSNIHPAHFGSSWTNDGNFYIHLRDTHSGYHPNETNPFSIDPTNPTSLYGTYPHRYPRHHQDFRGQYIYYDDGFGNDHASSPGEISF